jgi:deaminated glutathione amidase
MLAAAIQLTSTSDVAHNLQRARYWIARAAEAGARLVALPENFACMREEGSTNPAAGPLDGPLLDFLRDCAKQHGVVVAGGTLPERGPDDPRPHNTSLVIDADGTLRAVYRKIHLFDIDLPDVRLRESDAVAPGHEIVVAETAIGSLGLSVCYDVRFPELYRELVARGAQVLLVPSAFTVPTGSDHWEVLLRARAIENQCFVIASAQYGQHSARRRSYGRSLIVDPWGLVLARAADGEGLALADLDFERLEDVRRRLPALGHRRIESSARIATAAPPATTGGVPVARVPAPAHAGD